jgi:hypothetical protein
MTGRMAKVLEGGMAINDWTSFFTAETAAFATLTGLVFVALSINLKTILEHPGVAGRSGEALIVMVGPVLLGLAGLIAHQEQIALGIEWLIVGCAAWMVVTAIMISGRQAMRERTRREILVRVVGTQFATLPMIVAGGLLVARVDQGFYWQAGAAAACLVAGIVDAWVLLVEILR